MEDPSQSTSSTTSTFSGFNGVAVGADTRERSGSAMESEDASRCPSVKSGYRSGCESANVRGSLYSNSISGSEKPIENVVLPSSDSKTKDSSSTLSIWPCDCTPTANASTEHQSRVRLDSQPCKTIKNDSRLMDIVPPSMKPIVSYLSRIIDEDVYPKMLRDALAKRESSE